jgi:hypothetical protein
MFFADLDYDFSLIGLFFLLTCLKIILKRALLSLVQKLL